MNGFNGSARQLRWIGALGVIVALFAVSTIILDARSTRDQLAVVLTESAAQSKAQAEELAVLRLRLHTNTTQITALIAQVKSLGGKPTIIVSNQAPSPRSSSTPRPALTSTPTPTHKPNPKPSSKPSPTPSPSPTCPLIICL